MAKRGRKPQPTAVLRLSGSRALEDRTHEPVPIDAEPVAPAWLNAVARAEWDRIAPELAAMKIARRVDSTALATYCEACAEFVAACEDIDKNGFTISSGKYTFPNPAIRTKQQAWTRMIRIASEFGFTPSSRASMGIASKKKEGPSAKARFFKPA